MDPKRDYEFIEHTADLRFRSYGSTLSECFENAAKALCSSLCDPGSVDDKTTKEIGLSAEDLEELMHDFLSEILFLYETEGLLFSGFEVRVGGCKLSAELRGERYDREKHRIKTDIKAVTYHGLAVGEKDGLWTADVLCDV